MLLLHACNACFILFQVSLYLSSAGGDTSVERNYIHQRILPQLYHYARRRHLSFQLIDLNNFPDEWKDHPHEEIENNVYYDVIHNEFQFRQMMITKCMHESLGPSYFVSYTQYISIIMRLASI